MTDDADSPVQRRNTPLLALTIVAWTGFVLAGFFWLMGTALANNGSAESGAALGDLATPLFWIGTVFTAALLTVRAMRFDA
jgi:hypothetical protein